jgi:hypothetical protein
MIPVSGLVEMPRASMLLSLILACKPRPLLGGVISLSK